MLSGKEVNSTDVSPREGAVRFLFGKVTDPGPHKGGICPACKKMIKEEDPAVFVLPQDEDKHVGPFCDLYCKSTMDMESLTEILSHDHRN